MKQTTFESMFGAGTPADDTGLQGLRDLSEQILGMDIFGTEFSRRMEGGGISDPKKECAKGGVLILQVPGFSKDDTEVTVDKGIMTVECMNKNYESIIKKYKLNPDIIGMDVSVRNGICKITFEVKEPEMEIRFI
jgi:HSP20 family molecular chaperone IbpA